MSPIRRKTAEHMVLSKRISAHVTTVFEIDMTRVDALRKKYRQQYEERSGVKLTYLPFILKATVDALKAFPILNSSVEGDTIVYKQGHQHRASRWRSTGASSSPSSATRTRRTSSAWPGRSTTSRSARAARSSRSTRSRAAPSPSPTPASSAACSARRSSTSRRSAILGVGTIEKRPVVRDDAIAIRTMAYFALSFDHRIVDGADADRFMAHIKKGLQEFDESAL